MQHSFYKTSLSHLFSFFAKKQAIITTSLKLLNLFPRKFLCPKSICQKHIEINLSVKGKLGMFRLMLLRTATCNSAEKSLKEAMKMSFVEELKP